MPNSAQQHRTATGAFTPILIALLYKKAESYRRQHAYRGLRVERRHVSRTLAAFLFTLLIVYGVESNPGPGPTGKDSGNVGEGASAKSSSGPKTRQATFKQIEEGNGRPARLVLDNDHIEPSIADVVRTLNRMETTFNDKLSNIQQDMQEVKSAVNNVQQEVKALNEKIYELEIENESLSLRNSHLTRQLEMMQKTTEQLDARSRRNNIIIHGVPRQSEETGKMCEEAVRDVIRQKLKITDNVQLEDARRLGQSDNAPIAVTFLRHQDKVKVMSERRQLKGSNIFLNDDYTKSVREKRKELRKEMNDLKKRGHSVRMVYDRLVMEGEAAEQTGGYGGAENSANAW